MRVGGLDIIIQLHIIQLRATDNLFLLLSRQRIPAGQIMEILLNNHIASRGEPRILAGYQGSINGLLALRVLRPVDKTDEVATVKITETMNLVNRADHRSKPSRDLRRQLEAQVHALRPDMKEHVARC